MRVLLGRLLWFGGGSFGGDLIEAWCGSYRFRRVSADPERHRRAERTHRRAAASHEKAAAFYEQEGSRLRAAAEWEKSAKELAGAEIERDRYAQETTDAATRTRPASEFDLKPIDLGRRLRAASAALRDESERLRRDSEAMIEVLRGHAAHAQERRERFTRDSQALS